MFLQKLNLDQKQSYSTTATFENIIESLQLTFKHIPVLTPFSSTADSIETVTENLTKSSSVSIVTLKTFQKIAKLFNCSHVILQDREIMEKFEIDLSKVSKPIIEIIEEDREMTFPLLNLCKMYIRNREEDSFVILFILSKLFNGKVVCKRSAKLEILFKVFGIEWEILSYSDELEENCECVVFMDGYTECNAERVFCLGTAPSVSAVAENISISEFTNLSIDLSLAGKYKARIGEVYRAITPAVLKGYKDFDYARFSSVAK